ncbi:outer membrane lipoprotein-sorting protein, partial [Pseudomonadota bacterium]
SKTANVPTDFPYEEFKDIYMYAYDRDLKGCTTFRFNPEAFQGVLVKEQDEVRSHKVWLIEALPKTKEEAKETGYKKSVVFVRQDNFVVVRAIHWVEGSSRRKYQDVKRLEQIDGIWTILEMDMTTKKGKAIEHKTTLKFNNMRYNQDLDQGTFSIRRLEQGL